MANIKGFMGAAGVAAVAALGTPSAALADDGGRTFGYSISIVGVSDYLFRGVSLTSNSPAFQPFVEFTYGNDALTWYLDFWGSNVKNDFGDPWELDIYTGARFSTGKIAWDAGVLWYSNPQAHDAWDKDYWEFKLNASYNLTDKLALSITGYWTPDQDNYKESETIEGLISYELPQFAMFTPSLSGGIGYTTSPANDFFGNGRDSYTYWNVGVKLSVDKYFMDLRYWDTDLSTADQAGFYSRDDVADAKFVFSAGVNLP